MVEEVYIGNVEDSLIWNMYCKKRKILRNLFTFEATKNF